jgi:hypothetical protein
MSVPSDIFAQMVPDAVLQNHDQVHPFEQVLCQGRIDVIIPQISLEVLKVGAYPIQAGQSVI